MKRFVTYIYEYDRGIRGRNVGFIRTDIREDLCRMEIHIRGLDRVKGKGKVYLTVYDNTPVGIPAADILLSQGSGNLTLTCPKNLLGQSGYTVNDIQTVVIRYGNGKLLVGSFVNEPAPEILHGGFTEWTGASPHPGTPTSDTANSAQPEPQTSNAANSAQPELQTSNAANVAQPERQTFATATTAQPKTQTADATQLELQTSDTAATAQPETQTSDASDAAQLKAQTAASATDSESVSGGMTPHDFLKALLAGGMSNASENSAETNAASQTAEPDQPQASYRKIEITDIRSLPRRNWYLCNNKFLVHGFFNYHYLMLKTIDTKEGRRRFLGVPGIYEQPERMMALLFGFPEFEASEESLRSRPQSEQNANGVFGYWMCQLADE